MGVRAFINIIIVVIRQGSESQAGTEGRWWNPGQQPHACQPGFFLFPWALSRPPRQCTTAAFSIPFQASVHVSSPHPATRRPGLGALCWGTVPLLPGRSGRFLLRSAFSLVQPTWDLRIHMVPSQGEAANPHHASLSHLLGGPRHPLLSF